jgi:DHA2 family multidrug resistance protein-like MFS transporter
MLKTSKSASPKATSREWIGLAVILLPCLIYAMDLTVLNLAVPQLSEDLDPSAVQTLWIMDIYGFMVAGALITMGTLGDRIGRRKLLMIGAACFGTTSLIAAFAPTAELLIVARALLGLSAATLAPSTLSLIRNMFLDDTQRTFAIGVWVAGFSAGGAIGPVIGGFLLEHFWWGSVFLINVPCMALLLIVAPLLLPEYRDENAGKLDPLSAAQSVVAVLAVIWGLKDIAANGFNAWALLAVAAGVLIGVLFARRQKRMAEPLIDFSLFQVPAVRSSLVVNMAGVFVLFGGFFFVAQYLQLALGLGPLEAGFWLAPSGLIFAFSSLITPALAQRYRPSLIIGCGFLLTALGFAVLAFVGTLGAGGILAGLVLFSLGFSPVATLTTDLVMTSVAPEKAGQASGVSETSFEFGGATGIAVLGAIFVAIYRSLMDDLPTDLPANVQADVHRTIGGAFEAARTLPGPQGEALLTSAREAFASAMLVTSLLSAAIALFIAIFAATILRGPHDRSGRERTAQQEKSV